MDLTPFVLAALLLAITPGPGITYVVARTAADGRSAGMASCLGTALGGMVHVAAAALGVSALLAQSALAFGMVKWVGVAYLVYLGLKLLRQASPQAPAGPGPGVPMAPGSGYPASLGATAAGARKALLEGIAVEALNVKTALFFLAFLPQFVNSALPLAPQLLLLGSLCVLFNTVADMGAVLLAHRLLRTGAGPSGKARWMRRASGYTMLGLAAYMALARRGG